MPPRRTLLDDGEDFPMAGAPTGAALTAAGPIALDFGAPPDTLFQQLVRHWLNERHAPDILPVQAEALGALLDHIRRQVQRQCSPSPLPLSLNETFALPFADGYGPGAARGPRLVRGGARADHARADRSRARQVCRALLYPHAVVQGIYLACPTRLVVPSVADNGDRCLSDREVCAIHCGYA